MMKKLIIMFFLVFLSACSDENERFKDCEEVAQLVRYGEVEDNVTLQLTDMRYACGDCLRLYRVDKVVHSENDEYKFYLNKEISLYLLNEDLKNKISKIVCEENSTAKYTLIGEFRRNALGGGRLDVTDGTIVCDK